MSQPSRSSRRRRWIKRGLICTLAGVIVLAGLLVGGLRLLDSYASHYREALADAISQQVDARVSIAGLDVGWSWHGLVLYLDKPSLTRPDAKTPALTAKRIGLVFSFTDLISGSRRPDRLRIQDLSATLVATDNQLQLAHWRPTGEITPDLWSKLRAVRRQLSNVQLSDADITIRSPQLPNGRLHWTHLDAKLNTRNDQALSLSLSADGPRWWPRLRGQVTLRGSLRQPSKAHFTLHAGAIRPLVIARAAGADLAQKLHGGRTDIDVAGSWHDQHLTDTRIKLQTHDITRSGNAQPLVPAFQAVFDADNHTGDHRLQLRLTDLSGGSRDMADFQARARFDTDTRALAFTTRHLPISLFEDFAKLAAPRLADTHINGKLKQFDLHWQPGQPPSAKLDFAGLTVDNPHVAFGPVTGHYQKRGKHHSLVLRQASGALTAPRYIKGKLPITDLDGQVDWTPNDNGGWSIALHKLHAASRDAHLTMDGRIRLPADSGAPVVDLSASAVAPHAKRLLAHISQAPDLPNPKLRDWLATAIKSGSLDHARARIQGPLNHFPFAKSRPNEGFHLQLTGHGATVRYKPGWPQLTDARGTLTVDDNTLDLTLDGTKILGVAVGKTKAHIADVREPVMQLRGHVPNAPASRLLKFLAETPLHDKFGKLTDAFDVSGHDDLQLALRIPLKSGLGDVKVDGTVKVKGNTLHQKVLPGPITGIHGQLHFNEHGLRAPHLAGQLLNVPLRAKLTPAEGGSEQITVHATPKLPANREALAHYLPDAWLVYGRGQMPLRIAFTLNRSGDISPVRITSDLSGMAIRLPAPLHKPAKATAPLAVTIHPGGKRIEAKYNHNLRLRIRLDDRGRPRRIQALLGETDLKPPDRDGLWVGGHVHKLNAVGWFHAVRHLLRGAPARVGDGKQSTKKTGSSPAVQPHTLAFLGGDLSIDHLTFGDLYTADSHIQAKPMHNATGWRVSLGGQDTQGQITWSAAADQPVRIGGHLKKLALHTTKAKPAHPKPSAASKPDTQSTLVWPNIAPHDLPALKLIIQDFTVDKTSFGETHIDAHTTADGWSLDRFQLTGGALTGQAEAHWQRDSGVTQAKINTHFNGHGLAHLIQTFSQASPVRAKQVQIKSHLTITPNDRGLDLRFLNGHVHLALDQGSLLTVDPGPARLLGLLNLYVLPRRLRLDFRDVVDKGMAFDHVHGDFHIQQGQAYSDNLKIEAPSADIDIKGRIGLATRDYDEAIRVAPKVGSGVAIASTVLGGPIVGAAVFAVQKLLAKPIQQFSSVDYRLEGSWDDPQITHPSVNHK